MSDLPENLIILPTSGGHFVCESCGCDVHHFWACEPHPIEPLCLTCKFARLVGIPYEQLGRKP